MRGDPRVERRPGRRALRPFGIAASRSKRLWLTGGAYIDPPPGELRSLDPGLTPATIFAAPRKDPMPSATPTRAGSPQPLGARFRQGNAASLVGTTTHRQNSASQTSTLLRVEIDGALIGVDPRLETDLGSQIVAEPRHEGLIEQQGTEPPPREASIF